MTYLLKNNYFIFGSSLVFLSLSVFFIWIDLFWLCLFPIGLLGIYTAIYHTRLVFLSLAFLTPLSVNIEEYTNGLGLFLPTEPFFFGLMLLILFLELRKRTIPKEILNHPILLAAGLYISCLLITSITSSNPLISFKFLLSKLWFIIPMLLLAPLYFADRKTIYWFILLFVLGTVLTSIFTIIHHSLYDFGEKEGHWVMYPFFKDHTIYGAILALVIPWSVSLFYYKKTNSLENVGLVLIVAILLVALFFSYTRAAWLSVIGALGVWIIIYLRIKLSYLLVAGAIFIGALFVFWDNIQMELERNNEVHTTEEFGTRLQSAANVSTDASNLERINRWACAIEMFKERPLVGFGPGTYQFEYAQFQEPENLTIISTNFGDLGNAHSEYLGALSESGIFGLISFLILIGAMFYSGITLYYDSSNIDVAQKALVLSSILGLSTYFIHGFLNNYLDTDKAAVPIFGICAIFIALQQSTKKISNQKINDH